MNINERLAKLESDKTLMKVRRQEVHTGTRLSANWAVCLNIFCYIKERNYIFQRARVSELFSYPGFEIVLL